MKKLTIGVFFGSRSAEHDVSIVTALSSIIKPLEMTRKYSIVPVYIAKDGKWYSSDELKDIALYSSGRIDAWLAGHKPVAVQFDGGLTLLKPGLKNQSTRIDLAFPATHGTHGEDGDLMGVFEMANIPYVGCGVAASVLAMDKVLAKLIAETQGVPITKFQYFSKQDYEQNKETWLSQIEVKLKYPLFVKPAHLGSSIAISKVKTKNELENAIELALHYDDKALVEESVENLIEVTQPIIGNHDLTLAYLEQPVLKGDGVFDFDSKYMAGGKGGKKMGGDGAKQGAQGYSTLPANIPSQLYEAAQEMAKKVYIALGCSGIARVDMLIEGRTKQIYFNEVNPLPGSLYAHNWRAKGMSNVQLAEKLITLALESHESRKRLATTFDTNFLKQF